MAAKDYTLAVTPLTNTVWICKTSKRNKNLMTDDRVAVDKSHFIGIVLEWIHNSLADNRDTLEIKVDGVLVAELKIDRKALGLTPKKHAKNIEAPKPERSVATDAQPE